MVQSLTKKAVKRIIIKGLTGWEAGKLVLQDFVDSYHLRDTILTEADLAAIQNAPMEIKDAKDYNMFMALCRGFYKGCILGELACTEACLRISFLEELLKDTERHRMVELFEVCGPRVVTKKQHEGIVAAQREKKLKFEYSLGYVIEERFYAIAPREAREEIDEFCPDIESTEDFVSPVPEKYKDFCEQATDEIRSLYAVGKLLAFCHKKDMKKAEPLLVKWKNGQLSEQDTIKLVDMLYITGQELYGCDELPEWKDYMGKYHRYVFGDEDERFQHTYAILEDCSKIWIDEKDYYKRLPNPSEYITRNTELLLGLINQDDNPRRSIQSVGIELKNRLNISEQNIRLFFAVKAILDAVTDAVELDIPNKGGVLASQYIRLDAFIDLYNLRLEKLRENRKPWESAETRLEKVLKMLLPIDPEKLRPSPDSLKELRSDILKDAKGEEWLRTKVLSLECGDGFNFNILLNE